MAVKKSPFKTVTAVVGVVVLGMGLASQASAQCGNLSGYKTAATVWDQQARQGQARFTPTSFELASDSDRSDSGRDPIVGFWKATFVAGGSVIDSAFVQWHNDGTEIMNSSKPPATSNFCLGVWKHVGRFRYKLNHFAISSDPGGNLIGPANIREDVLLDRSGDSYVGTFTIDQYDVHGNLLAHVAGQISATRITADTSAQSLF
jgi:hypothetical protein